MNQKKCPKCGENNPPEAVMCWACYTPLTAGAVAPGVAPGAVRPGGPPGPGGPAAATDTGGGAGGIQPWMYAVGGVVLLVILVVGAKVLMGGDPPGDAAPGGDTGGTSSTGMTGSPGNVMPPSRSSGTMPLPPSNSNSTGPGSTTILPAPYNIGAIPNPQAPVGIVGIAPVQPLSPSQGASIAKYAVSQFANVDHWGALEVFVFQDQQANQAFKDYQTGRRSYPLGADDFNSAELNNLWPQTMAVYVFYKGGKERVVKPGSADWYAPLLAQ